MPKIGMEPIRRAALVKATIVEVGAAGTLNITVSRIAKRAGMSTALAHHYFGGKDQIFLAAMREILRQYHEEVLIALRRIPDRAEAIVTASFAPSCFDSGTVSAWMSFYAQAQTNPAALRLLRLYQRRLRSNLSHALRGQVADPKGAADLIASLIDGVYIRRVFAARDTEGGSKVLELLRTLKGAA